MDHSWTICTSNYVPVFLWVCATKTSGSDKAATTMVALYQETSRKTRAAETNRMQTSGYPSFSAEKRLTLCTGLSEKRWWILVHILTYTLPSKRAFTP